MTTSKHNLRSTIFSLTFTAAAIAMLGCGVDSGSTPSEPAVCDTDSCDLDNNNAWSCVCDLNQDGTFCDPFHAAPGGGSEADWCGTACIAIGTHGSFACANNCDEADGFSGVGNYDSDANKVACSMYNNAGTCGSWNPASKVTLSGGVYRVNAAWLAGVVSTPAPLWTCDDATIDGLAGGGFEIHSASTGELLYVLGLRNNDKPVSINGLSLNTYHQAIVAAGRLYFSGVTSYSLVVTRGGTNITLSYLLV